MTTSDWRDKGVMTSIQGNGTGMEQDQLSRIFNPFYSTQSARGGNRTWVIGKLWLDSAL
ncbi:MAG: hypothetical protein V3U62_03535 [Sedimenticolaceae bacterium]